MKSKLITTIFIFLFFISYTSAIGFSNTEIESIGNYKINECVEIVQTCATCTEINITSIRYPNSSKALSSGIMNKAETEFNYTFCNTPVVGEYLVNFHGEAPGAVYTESYKFKVSGTNYPNNYLFYAFISLISISLLSLGFWKKDPIIVMLGCFTLYFMGIYSLLNGIGDIRDPVYTWGISLIILSVASYISIFTGLELMDK